MPKKKRHVFVAVVASCGGKWPCCHVSSAECDGAFRHACANCRTILCHLTGGSRRTAPLHERSPLVSRSRTTNAPAYSAKNEARTLPGMRASRSDPELIAFTLEPRVPASCSGNAGVHARFEPCVRQRATHEQRAARVQERYAKCALVCGACAARSIAPHRENNDQCEARSRCALVNQRLRACTLNTQRYVDECDTDRSSCEPRHHIATNCTLS
jgi:hypothetical protein